MNVDIDDLRTALERPSYANPDIDKMQQMAGSAYISATDRTGGKTSRIALVAPQHCGHQNRICLACVPMWGWDYQIHFERTGGGRKMRQSLIDLGLNPDEIANGQAKLLTSV